MGHVDGCGQLPGQGGLARAGPAQDEDPPAPTQRRARVAWFLPWHRLGFVSFEGHPLNSFGRADAASGAVRDRLGELASRLVTALGAPRISTARSPRRPFCWTADLLAEYVVPTPRPRPGRGLRHSPYRPRPGTGGRRRKEGPTSLPRGGRTTRAWGTSPGHRRKHDPGSDGAAPRVPRPAGRRPSPRRAAAPLP